jgi:hypothetical protein
MNFLTLRVGTHFKLVAALSSADAFIDEVARLLTRDIEPDEWSLPYWVPALVRRIKIDGELRAKMLEALGAATSVSMKLTKLTRGPACACSRLNGSAQGLCRAGTAEGGGRPDTGDRARPDQLRAPAAVSVAYRACRLARGLKRR